MSCPNEVPVKKIFVKPIKNTGVGVKILRFMSKMVHVLITVLNKNIII